MYQNHFLEPCRDGCSADEKSPVNRSILLILGKNGCVVLLPQNGYVEIDLPKEIDFGEQVIYFFHIVGQKWR